MERAAASRLFYKEGSGRFGANSSFETIPETESANIELHTVALCGVPVTAPSRHRHGTFMALSRHLHGTFWTLLTFRRSSMHTIVFFGLQVGRILRRSSTVALGALWHCLGGRSAVQMFMKQAARCGSHMARTSHDLLHTSRCCMKQAAGVGKIFHVRIGECV